MIEAAVIVASQCSDLHNSRSCVEMLFQIKHAELTAVMTLCDTSSQKEHPISKAALSFQANTHFMNFVSLYEIRIMYLIVQVYYSTAVLTLTSCLDNTLGVVISLHVFMAGAKLLFVFTPIYPTHITYIRVVNGDAGRLFVRHYLY